MSATPVNPLALVGIGAGASFAGGILGAIGSGPSKQMQALNSQIQDCSQAQVNAYNTQAIQRGAATARDLSAVIGGGPGGMGGVSVGNATAPGVNNKFAAAQAAEAQTSAAESEGTIKSNEAGREEFNTAVGEEKQLPSVFATANQGGSVA